MSLLNDAGRRVTISGRVLCSILLLMLVFASRASACSVPVFRYALERWPADLFEVDVFYREKLSPDQRSLVSRLEDQSLVNGGSVNWEVVLCRVEDPLAEDLQTVRDALGEVTDPHVVLRRPGGRRGSPTVWQGPMSDIAADLWTSPVRTALINRLTDGDSVVWLIFRGRHAEQSQNAATLLRSQFPVLADEISLPNGVGLPGSEVLSQVSLAIRFSVIEIDDRIPSEAMFRKQILSGHPKPIPEDETLIVPAFGRGRALALLTAGELDEAAVEEYTRFLCGACSCQVKQGNPGFDLLLNVDWDQRLWGENAPAEIVAATLPAEPPVPASEPKLVTIPPGQPTAVVVTESPIRKSWTLSEALIVIAAVSGVLLLNLLWIIRRRSDPRR